MNAVQKSAEGIVILVLFIFQKKEQDEGLNMKLRERDPGFDGEKDADNRR